MTCQQAETKPGVGQAKTGQTRIGHVETGQTDTVVDGRASVTQLDGAPGDHAPGVRSIERVLAILSLFSEDRPRISLTEIVRSTGLPKTTVLRHVATLQANGLLWQDESGRYVLGPRLLQWSGLAYRGWQFPGSVRAAMQAAATACEEALHLYVRQGTQRVCVAHVEVPRSLRYVVDVGDALPLWAGAVSKVLLADAPLDLLIDVAGTSPAGTAHLPLLQEGIEEARRRGFATSHAELEPGLASVAVPVWGPLGTVVATVSFGGPTIRFNEQQITRFVGELRKVADVMMTSLAAGWPTWK